MDANEKRRPGRAPVHNAHCVGKGEGVAQHAGLQLHELGDVVFCNNRAVLLSHAAAAAAGVNKDLRALRDAALWRVQ